MSDITSPDYWNQRYLEGNTPWDIGYASPPIIEYFKSVTNKDARILIPGAGNAHEAGWLWKNGFRKLTVVDIAEKPLEALRQALPDLPNEQTLHMDFFDLEAEFDLIVEQTFFCALPPSWRKRYTEKMHSLLSPTGRLFGVLFSFPLTADGPPFGGNREEYHKLFAPIFDVLTLEPCRNSIPPRQGNELFIELSKR